MNNHSVIFETSTRFLLPLLLLFSLFLLLRGHNEPGGGFVGGLVAAAAIALYALAAGVENAHRMLRLDLRTLMGVGLLFAIVAGVFGLLTGGPILTGLWYSQPIPVVGKVGTPLLFDVGVYLVVLGVILKILFTLMTAPEVAQQPVSIKGLVATNVHETAQDETPHAVRDDRWR
ncbi:Na+/H+ antiporter subunit B [Chloroflexi bacterium TSY]|nr:Na+/H+ antiporter subunit B [Chloroflexi bacterium TSY]